MYIFTFKDKFIILYYDHSFSSVDRNESKTYVHFPLYILFSEVGYARPNPRSSRNSCSEFSCDEHKSLVNSFAPVLFIVIQNCSKSDNTHFLSFFLLNPMIMHSKKCIMKQQLPIFLQKTNPTDICRGRVILDFIWVVG